MSKTKEAGKRTRGARGGAIVKTRAAAGGFVAKVGILPVVTPPDVVFWGDRVFVNQAGKYVEGFAVVAL